MNRSTAYPFTPLSFPIFTSRSLGEPVLKTFHLLLFNFLLVDHPFLPLLLFFPLIISSVLAFCHLHCPPLLFTANRASLGLWEGLLTTVCKAFSRFGSYQAVSRSLLYGRNIGQLCFPEVHKCQPSEGRCPCVLRGVFWSSWGRFFGSPCEGPYGGICPCSSCRQVAVGKKRQVFFSGKQFLLLCVFTCLW